MPGNAHDPNVSEVTACHSPRAKISGQAEMFSPDRRSDPMHGVEGLIGLEILFEHTGGDLATVEGNAQLSSFM